jgi:transposase
MTKSLLLTTALWLMVGLGPASAQSEAPQTSPTVVVEDVDRFWTAYDAVRAETDPATQRLLFERLYIEPGTAGLHAFIAAKGYTVDDYLDAIRRYPRYWDTIRPRTALAAGALGKLDAHLVRFRELYPDLRPAGVYFEIGALRSAGTTLEDKVLIGVEMATGDPSVDTSEMPERLQRFLAGYFASRPLDNLDLLAMHEFVHTQERGERRNLLAQAIYEGVADFVAQQVTGRMPDLPYVGYGPANDAAIKTAFARDMMGADYSGWLYNNTDNPFGVRDLGYYVGYAIVSRYYAQSEDKSAAIKAMIELDFSDADAVQRLVDTSGYFVE